MQAYYVLLLAIDLLPTNNGSSLLKTFNVTVGCVMTSLVIPTTIDKCLSSQGTNEDTKAHVFTKHQSTT